MRFAQAAWGGWISVIGALLLVVATGLTLKDQRMAAASQSAEGVVTALERAGRGQWAIVRFQTDTGRWVEIRSRWTSAMRIGERTAILYDPSSPHRATIDQFGERHMPATFFAVVGVLMCLCGATLAVLGLRRGRRAGSTGRTPLA